MPDNNTAIALTLVLVLLTVVVASYYAHGYMKKLGASAMEARSGASAV